MQQLGIKQAAYVVDYGLTDRMGIAQRYASYF